MSGIQILLSDHNGINIPQLFVNNFNFSGADIEDIAICEKGPDEESYWDAWNNICRDAFITHNGKQYYLYQDGDLFAICDELLSDEEYKEFFGEERW